MSTWQVLLLILLSCASLIIALYCLFFMVPIKRFWERIESLGGGMKGIETHVEGVRRETQGRIRDLEKEAKTSLEDQGRRLHGRIKTIASETQQTRDALAGLSEETATMRSDVSRQHEELEQLRKALDSLSRTLEQVHGDFNNLSAELAESVRRQASESYQEIESIVLAALDAIQNEILLRAEESRETVEADPRARRGRHSSGGASQGWRSRSDSSPKIISAAPLFAELDRPSSEREERQQADDENGQKEGSDNSSEEETANESGDD